jgi:hypothetical protein
MITRHELTRRLTRTRIHLDHRVVAGLHGTTSRRATAARDDVARVLEAGVIDRAHRHLADHQAGYPASSVPDPGGKGGHSDRTSDLATGGAGDHDRTDPVTAETSDLDAITARLEVDSLQLLKPGAPVAKIAARLETDAQRAWWILLRWAREPDIRWCQHCRKTNGHREPVLRGKYRDLCARCGAWRATNKALPPADILRYLQTRQPVPPNLLAKHRMKLPRDRKRGRAA